MTAQTELVVRNILSLDPEVRQQDVERAIDVLRGRQVEAEPQAPIPYIKYKDAVKFLCISRRTLDNYLHRGILDKVVRGDGRTMGISRASYERLVALEVAKQDSGSVARAEDSSSFGGNPAGAVRASSGEAS